MRKNYGLPYMGSKNKLAEEIVNFLPQKKVLVDLFGGGGAISVCASQSGKYEKIIYNELNTLIAETFQKALNGDYENERRWVSREEFEKLKKTDGYVAICFSFSNNCNTYMYGPKIEPYKRAYHYAIVFDDFRPFNELFDDETTEKIKKSVEGITDLKERRIKFSHALGDYILSLERCQYLERQEKFDLLKHTMTINGTHRNMCKNLESQERVSTLKHTLNVNALEKCGLGRDSITHSIGSTFQNRVLEKAPIEVFNKDYADVELPSPEECVIYCDIPYKNTTSYTIGCFDYERFYKWCQEKTSEGYQIFVSSYELPEDLFISVWEKQRHCKATSGSGKQVVEKIYTVRKSE